MKKTLTFILVFIQSALAFDIPDLIPLKTLKSGTTFNYDFTSVELENPNRLSFTIEVHWRIEDNSADRERIDGILQEQGSFCSIPAKLAGRVGSFELANEMLRSVEIDGDFIELDLKDKVEENVVKDIGYPIREVFMLNFWSSEKDEHYFMTCYHHKRNVEDYFTLDGLNMVLSGQAQIDEQKVKYNRRYVNEMLLDDYIF